MHTPTRRFDPKAYRDCLRLEMGFRCVYCLSHEADVGAGAAYGGFEVEHFKPESLFGSLRSIYSNLNWACRACNQAKGNVWPSDDERRAGFEFVDFQRDIPSDHLRIVGDRVVAVNGSGKAAFTIDTINLNSRLHQTRRRAHLDAIAKAGALHALMQTQRALAREAPAELAQRLLASIEQMERKLSALWDAIASSQQPWDAPETCLCAPKSRPRRAKAFPGK
jgi:hypothetical protein